MKVDVLLGLQWGDEGKGKVVDVLTPRYDVVARFQGGPNAGHTLEFEGQKYVLRSIPSGIFQGSKVNIIGNGVVLDPALFKAEAEALEASGHPLKERLHISKKAHLILPTHRILDAAYEAAKGDAKVGTTGKGIGPTYTDKVSRNGVRVGDILHNFEEVYGEAKARHEQILKSLNYEYNITELEKQWLEGIEYLKQFHLVDSEHEINNLLKSGKSVLCEGAQGTMLDVDFGSYPFVTSSNTICAGACTGLGIGPNKIGNVYGIMKAYCTRVGSGPFPTELFDETGKKIRDLGHEYGHVRGAQDLYQYMIPAENNPVSHVAYDYPKCNMGTGYQEWSDYCSAIFNHNAQYKQITADMTRSTYPKQMLVRVTKDGKPVQRATVNFWGSRATFRDIYAEPGNSPYMKKKTDANGEFTINDIYRMFIPDYNNTPNLPPKSPVDEFPFSRWYCFVVEVELDGGQTKSVWLSDLDIVPEYLNGGQQEPYVFEIQL